MDLGAEVLEVGFLRDDANRAAHRARSIQGALRTPQHLDVVDVEHARVQRVRQRRVVDVETGDVMPEMPRIEMVRAVPTPSPVGAKARLGSW